MEPLKNLYLALAEIFDSEGREGGVQAAQALINASHKIKQPEKYTNSFLHEVNSSLNFQAHILNKLVLKASPYIKWGGSDLREGRIPDDLANRMPMTELVGPDCMFFNENVRFGYGFRTKG